MTEPTIDAPGESPSDKAIVYWMNRALAAEDARRCVGCMEWISATSRSCSCTRYEVDELREQLTEALRSYLHSLTEAMKGWAIDSKWIDLGRFNIGEAKPRCIGCGRTEDELHEPDCPHINGSRQ